MIIVEDTRQQAGKHETKPAAWIAAGDLIIRSKLPFGDYALPPAVAIDTKANMAEIAHNIGGPKSEHARFRDELKAAKAAGTRLYILIENAEGIRSIDDVARWKNPRRTISPRAINGPQLSKAMRTISDRYGAVFRFCAPEEAPDVIKDILTNGQ